MTGVMTVADFVEYGSALDVSPRRVKIRLEYEWQPGGRGTVTLRNGLSVVEVLLYVGRKTWFRVEGDELVEIGRHLRGQMDAQIRVAKELAEQQAKEAAEKLMQARLFGQGRSKSDRR